MKLRNPHRSPVTVPTLGQVVDPGGAVEVTGDAAKALQAQGWHRVGGPKKRTPRTKPSTSKDEGTPTTAEATASDPEEA